MYRIEIVRAGRATYWSVKRLEARIWTLVQDGDERQHAHHSLSLRGAKKLALAWVPSGAEYTVTFDTPKGIRDFGPFYKW